MASIIVLTRIYPYPCFDLAIALTLTWRSGVELGKSTTEHSRCIVNQAGLNQYAIAQLPVDDEASIM
jgi:hypothetical protein